MGKPEVDPALRPQADYFRVNNKHTCNSLSRHNSQREVAMKKEIRISVRNCGRYSGFAILLTAAVRAILNCASASAQEGYFRLQLKHGGQYLDADHCSTTVALNPGSTWENGACQLWRFVPADDGWSQLQLKHSGQYLDADHCTSKIGLNPGSN